MISIPCAVRQAEAWRDFEHFLRASSSKEKMPEKVPIDTLALFVEHARKCPACEEFLQQKIGEITNNSQHVN